MKKYIILLLASCCPGFHLQAQAINTYNQYLTESNQVLFVKTASPDAIQGSMLLYERKRTGKPWKIKDSFAVVVGRAGLATDLHTSIPFSNTMPVKREGDGKSPAGVFTLGNVFSYHSLSHMHMPFVQVDTNFYCVDDVTSAYYNTLIVKDTATGLFNSFEYMQRKDELYEYGVWVLYNSHPAEAGDGSCIFIHVWRDEQSGTAGCTAMSKAHIIKLIHWLNQHKKPVLLQVVQTN